MGYRNEYWWREIQLFLRMIGCQRVWSRNSLLLPSRVRDNNLVKHPFNFVVIYKSHAITPNRQLCLVLTACIAGLHADDSEGQTRLDDSDRAPREHRIKYAVYRCRQDKRHHDQVCLLLSANVLNLLIFVFMGKINYSKNTMWWDSF